METFTEYIESKKQELAVRESALKAEHRQDEANLTRISANIYDVCGTIYKVFHREKPKEDFESAYLNKLDELGKTWKASAERADAHGDVSGAVVGEIKLQTLRDVQEKFTEVWSIENE